MLLINRGSLLFAVLFAIGLGVTLPFIVQLFNPSSSNEVAGGIIALIFAGFYLAGIWASLFTTIMKGRQIKRRRKRNKEK